MKKSVLTHTRQKSEERRMRNRTIINPPLCEYKPLHHGRANTVDTNSNSAQIIRS